MIEVGQTYEFDPHLDSVERFHAGRKALVLGKLGGDMFAIRWANGQDNVAFAASLRGPVEAVRPGVDEPCLICGGLRTVPVYRPDRIREWIQHFVEDKPCPNCATRRPPA